MNKTRVGLLVALALGILPATAAAQVKAGAKASASASTEGEAWNALVALGYKPAEVTQMLKPFAGSGGTTEELIRRALQGAVRAQ